MNLEEYITSVNSNWVTLKTCKLGDKLNFVSDMTFEEQEFNGKKTHQCVLTVTHQTLGQEMKLCLNKTNVKNLSEVYGTNSQNWIGKTLSIALKTKYSNGKEDFIYGHLIRGQSPYFLEMYSYGLFM
jgi:hypothetical protein